MYHDRTQASCPVKKNAETAVWAKRYQTALRRYLRSGTGAKPPSNLRLGRQAATAGIETLDVVRIHEQALAAVAAADLAGIVPGQALDLAKLFFAEVIVPIEQTHPAARQADARVKQLTRALRRRTQETVTIRQQLSRSVARRRVAEAALEKSGEHRAKLLSDARRLQGRLRRLTRGMLEAQEDERRQTSKQLYDAIAQSLLAIDLKLLTLRMASKASTRNLKKEIDETQRLVVKSEHTIRGLSHESERDHET